MTMSSLKMSFFDFPTNFSFLLCFSFIVIFIEYTEISITINIKKKK